MTERDFMIGDWVHFVTYHCGEYIDTYGRIAGINPMEGAVMPTTFSIEYCKDGKRIAYIGCSVRCIKPIPINADILRKNGFILSRNLKQYEYIEYKDDGCDKCSVCLDQNNNPLLIQVEKTTEFSKVERVNIRSIFVHILQHSLKLCGILKNIEL